MNTTHEENVDLMTGLHEVIARAAHDYVHSVIPEGGMVPTSAVMGAVSWLMVDVMLLTGVEYDDQFLTALRQTYEAVKFVNAQAPDDESVH